MNYSQKINKATKEYLLKCTDVKSIYTKKGPCKEYFQVRAYLMKQPYSIDGVLEYLDEVIMEPTSMKLWEVIAGAESYQDYKKKEKEAEELGPIKEYQQYDMSMLEGL